MQNMNELWSKNDIEKILMQMEEMDLPFAGYSLDVKDGSPVTLGKGASGYVYRVHKDKKKNVHYALKVLGFGGTRQIKEEFEAAVRIQSSLSNKCDNVVKIYDHAGVIVKIEGDNKVVNAKRYDDDQEPVTGDNELYLQFIVMEEVVPVIRSEGHGKVSLSREKLAGDTKEILKLAYDVGTALNEAHKMNTLHRDVKLENVFYSPRNDMYKLGDFGIAKASPNLQADTKAFTKGYGAPEVIFAPEDKYDSTADIYSYGIMIYILLNNLRFPDSNNYSSNLSLQYSKGYEPPSPATGSEDIARFVLTMCSYDPDERYQSFEDVLNELDSLIYGKHTKFVREHNSGTYAMGFVMWILGVFFCKISFYPDMDTKLGAGMMILLALTACKFVFSLYEKNTGFVSFVILVLGIILGIKYGFTWQRVLVILFLVIFDESSGLLASAVITMLFARVFEKCYLLENATDMTWISITFLALSGLLLLQHYAIELRDNTISSLYGKRNIVWISAVFGFLDMYLYRNVAVNYPERIDFLLGWIFGEGVAEKIIQHRLDLAGIAGFIFCLVWIGREMIMRLVVRIKEKAVIGGM